MNSRIIAEHEAKVKEELTNELRTAISAIVNDMSYDDLMALTTVINNFEDYKALLRFLKSA